MHFQKGGIDSRLSHEAVTRMSLGRVRPIAFSTLTLGVFQNLKAPLLIVHAEDDLDIPVWHAQRLFDAFLEKHLPPLPEITPEMMAAIMVSDENPDTGPAPSEVSESVEALLQERAAQRRELVRVSEMERVGRMEVFAKDRKDGEVVFLHTRWGAHDVGLLEGVQDLMAEMFKMGTSPARK